MKTKIILVRHAECIGNVEKRLSGVTDFNLTERGKKQAKKIGELLKNKNIRILYTSPLKRAIDTGKCIAEANNISEIYTDNGLTEINYGVCDGMKWNDINKEYPKIKELWKKINKYPVGIPKQEKFVDVQKRMIETIAKIANKHDGKVICIVSHGIAIQSYMCYLYGINFNEIDKLSQLHNVGYIEFEIWDNGNIKLL